jgi:pimeloyl-ACP methyl ester carboxylesterase
MADVLHAIAAPDGAPPLAYAQSGRGRDVVLIHGALSQHEEILAALGGALAEAYRVTAFDRPGHGGSARAGVTGSPWSQARQLREAARSLGLERPVLVGHSFGGAVALAWAAQFAREVAGVVALAPICRPELRLEHLVFAPRAAPGFGPLIAGALSAGADPALLPTLWRAMFLPQAPTARFLEIFPFAEAGACAHTEAEGEDAVLLNLGLTLLAMNARACTCPVRILAGDRDVVVANRRHGAWLASWLPDARYDELPGLGHMLHHFAPGRVAEAVRSLAR